MNTVSLEVAKKLKAAGWAENSGYYYIPEHNYAVPAIAVTDSKSAIVAPTLGELVRALPVGYGLISHKNRKGKVKWICSDNLGIMLIAGDAPDTPEDACGLAWIALQEGER